MRFKFSLIIALLAGFMACRAAVSPAEDLREVESRDEGHAAKLDVKIDALSLDDATLDEAVATLQERTHANIIVRWPALETDKVSRSAKVRVKLYDLTLAKTIDTLLVLYGDSGLPLTSDVKDGVIQILPANARPNGVRTLIYDVGDFTARFVGPNDPAAPQPGNGLFGSGGVKLPPLPADQLQRVTALVQPTTRAASTLSRQECMDVLVKVIEETVDVDTWRDNGGALGAIREIDGLLFVDQLPTGHHKIQLALKNLRKLRSAIDRGETVKADGIDLLAE